MYMRRRQYSELGQEEPWVQEQGRGASVLLAQFGGFLRDPRVLGAIRVATLLLFDPTTIGG